MKNIIKGLLVLFLLWGMNLEARDNSPKVRLEKGEKKFKQLESYKLKDYHFAWNIIYMDKINFDTKESDGKSFKLPSKVRFRKSLEIGKATKQMTKKSEKYLAKAIMKKEYFWKAPMPPSALYSFTSLRFMEKDDSRYKAITELKDISDMLGSIDTMAEWRLWFSATRRTMGMAQPYSYKKVGRLHRIRFASTNTYTCEYHEYFNYYDDYGRKVKTKKLKKKKVIGCHIIMI